MPVEEFSKCVQEMREWLNLQPYLPKDVDDFLLFRFAHSCYFDLEKAKKAAELFFTLRGTSPELLSDRDPLAPHMQKFLKVINISSLEISGNRKLWLWQLNDPGLYNYDYLIDAKVFILSTDAWLLDDNTKLYDGDVILLDLKDISLKILTKLNMSIAKKISKYQQDAIPIRLKQIHLVNAPSVMDKVFMIMKPLLRKEVTDLIHFHQPNSTTLYDFIKKEDLPKDYGGTRDSLSDQMPQTLKMIMDKRSLLLNENLWTSSQKKKKSTDISSFRTLAID